MTVKSEQDFQILMTVVVIQAVQVMNLQVRVSDWPFGSSSIRINMETANNYIDSSSVSTAVSGTPSLIFDIPRNQGGSVFACTDPEGILAFGNCNTYITNDRDRYWTIPAR